MRDPKVPFFFITNKAKAPHGSALSLLCSFIITHLIIPLVIWTLLRSYDKDIKNGLSANIYPI